MQVYEKVGKHGVKKILGFNTSYISSCQNGDTFVAKIGHVSSIMDLTTQNTTIPTMDCESDMILEQVLSTKGMENLLFHNRLMNKFMYLDTLKNMCNRMFMQL